MLFEVGGIVGFLLLALWIWALVDCISSDSAMVRNLPKFGWLVIVILLLDIGAVLWLLLGRPLNKHWRPTVYGEAAPPARRELGDRASRRRTSATSPTAGPPSSTSASRRGSTSGRWNPATTPASTDDDDELAARAEELDRREAELRQRELELRARELDARERPLDEE